MKKVLILLCVVFIMGSNAVHGQMLDGLGFGGDKHKSKGPMKISADRMLVDSAKNLAVFTGNVKVDDDNMTLNCEVMKIYLEDKKTEAKSSGSQNKQIEKIVCTGDVVITKKIIDPEEAKQGAQRAIAGKAVYKLKEKLITLTDKPVVLRGKSKMTGTSLTLHTDDNQIYGENVKVSMVQNKPPDEDTEKKKL